MGVVWMILSVLTIVTGIVVICLSAVEDQATSGMTPTFEVLKHHFATMGY